MSNRAEAFEQAVELWEISAHIGLQERLTRSRKLAELGVFSVAHVAKIARVDPKTLRKYNVKSDALGGKFDPEALTALQTMSKQVSLGDEPSKPLIRLCVRTGCSLHAIASLIGLQAGKVYRAMEEM